MMKADSVVSGTDGRFLSASTTASPQITAVADLCVAFRRASRAITHLYEVVLAPTGLKATQFVLLQALASAGAMAQWQLAEEYGVSPESLSRRLAKLREAGFITQETTAGGERVYRLTPAGAQELRRLLPYWARAQARLRTVLNPAQWEAATAAADLVTRAARAAEDARVANTSPEPPSSAASVGS